MKRIILATLASITISSCYYDKLEELNPASTTNPCATTSPATYSGSIKLIFDLNCTSCHSSSNASGNVKLSTIEEIKPYAASGLLLNVIERQSGYQAMPPSSVLAPCQVDKIKTWIQTGTPQ